MFFPSVYLLLSVSICVYLFHLFLSVPICFICFYLFLAILSVFFCSISFYHHRMLLLVLKLLYIYRLKCCWMSWTDGLDGPPLRTPVVLTIPLKIKIKILVEFWINVLISPADIGNWKMNYTSSAQIQQNNFPTKYSNDICFHCCSDLFSKSAFVDLKSQI